MEIIKHMRIDRFVRVKHYDSLTVKKKGRMKRRNEILL